MTFQMDKQLHEKITNLRKSGRLAEAWALARPAVEANPLDQYAKGALFWVCYAYLKEIQNGIKGRATSNNGDHMPGPGELEQINYYLDWIAWLNIPSGGIEYRNLILLFNKNLEYLSKLILLLVGHIDDLFEGKDKEPYLSPKGELPSLMLKFARKVAKGWLENENVRLQLTIDQICEIFAKTRREAIDKHNLIWLDYDEAKCLIFSKRFARARDYILPVLRKKQGESWAWHALAMTFYEKDPTAAVALLSKAICVCGSDSFALPMLKEIAPLLARQKFVDEASMCVKRATDCYISNGWKIKPDLERLINEPWYNKGVDLSLLPTFLQEQASTAPNYIFGELTSQVAIVEFIHASGKGFHAYLNKEKSIAVRRGILKSGKLPSPGDYIRLTLSAEDQTVIAAELCDSEDLANVGHAQGTLKITDKGFGFIDSTFVPPNLIQNEMHGNLVSVLWVVSFDKKKKKFGRKALKIERL